MKFLFTFLAALVCNQYIVAQNIGIGTATPHASAMLDVVSTNKGLLVPRVIEANRPASPATGLLIYQTNNTPGFYYYNGSTWQMLGGGSGFSLPYTGSTAGNALNITSTDGIGITGASSAATGNWYGGQFTSASTAGSGVYGAATAATGITFGGQFTTLSTNGRGVYGEATSVTGVNIGGYFVSKSSSGYGVIGEAHSTTGFTNGVIGMSESSQGTGVWGHGQSETGDNVGVRGTTNSSAGIGGYFYAFVSNEYLALKTGQGQVQFDALAGTGNRMVVANENGRLSTKPIGVSISTAFQVVTSAANTTFNTTRLSYPNPSINDMVTVTPVWTGTYLKSPIGVFFTEGEWRVFRQDEVEMPLGVKFNVIVIKQ